MRAVVFRLDSQTSELHYIGRITGSDRLTRWSERESRELPLSQPRRKMSPPDWARTIFCARKRGNCHDEIRGETHPHPAAGVCGVGAADTSSNEYKAFERVGAAGNDFQRRAAYSGSDQRPELRQG